MSQITDKSDAKPNRLVTLKLLVFLFFGALQCVYAYLPNHMEWLGFTRNEIRTVTLVASLVSIIGTLIIGFILDRVSVNRPSSYGKWLRVLLFICFIATGVFFGLLLTVTPEHRAVIDKDPTSTFSCNNKGGHLFVKRINNETCSSLNEQKGHLKLLNCSYTCELPENFKYLYHPSVAHQKNNPAFARIQNDPGFLTTDGPSEEEDYDENKSYNDENLPQPEALQAPTQAPIISPPHICVNNGTNVNCHVYLDGVIIKLDTVEGIEVADDKNRFSDNWCKHPLANFGCHVPERQVEWMKFLRSKENGSHCSPAIECLIEDPHGQGSILEEAKTIILQQVPYESYITLRIIAEIFPIIIHMLLNLAIVIATRENSVQRGDVGHQLAFYPLGVLVFASVLGVINHAVDTSPFLIPIIVFSVTMFICAIVVIFSGKLPLTPSDWWWHTKCGMLAIPMSALKRYKWVITAIAITVFIIGCLWHVQEAFRHIFHIDIIEEAIVEGSVWRAKTFVYIIGAILAIPLLWNGEKIVDCFGHSNIFILSLVSFALRFTGLYYDNESSWSTLYEILEPISFYLAWLAFLLFIRHSVPKKFLALGQSFLVILFFALGRAIGFFFGVSIISEPRHLAVLNISNETAQANQIIDLQNIHSIWASIACAAALIYFIIYHLILLPRYRVPTNRFATNNESNVSPQRVFHDERSRKGYFRY